MGFPDRMRDHKAPYPVLYFIAPSYSGSTLLTYLAASHPDVATIGERKKFSDKALANSVRGSSLCSCGKPFSSCEFWQLLRSEVEAKVPASIRVLRFTNFQLFRHGLLNRLAMKTNSPYRRSGVWRLMPSIGTSRLSSVLAANVTLIEAVLSHSGKRLFVDSSKSLEHYILLTASPELDVRPVLLLRDGRAYLWSVLRRQPGREAEDVVRKWLKMRRTQETFLRVGPMEFHVLRYEDLCADVSGTMESLFEFAGLEPCPLTAQIDTGKQHVMGNEMRLRREKTIENTEEWRKRLTQEQVRTFERIAGEFNESLGYVD